MCCHAALGAGHYETVAVGDVQRRTSSTSAEWRSASPTKWAVEYGIVAPFTDNAGAIRIGLVVESSEYERDAYAKLVEDYGIFIDSIVVDVFDESADDDPADEVVMFIDISGFDSCFVDLAGDYEFYDFAVFDHVFEIDDSSAGRGSRDDYSSPSGVSGSSSSDHVGAHYESSRPCRRQHAKEICCCTPHALSR